MPPPIPTPPAFRLLSRSMVPEFIGL